MLPEDNSRHPRSKRKFEEMDESITYDDDIDSETIIADDDDEPPLKKHKGATLGIDILIEAIKAELVEAAQAFRRICKAGMKINDPTWESWNKLRRRRTCLADVQQFVLDHEIEPFTSGLLYTFLFAPDCPIAENERQMEKVEQEFDYLHKGGMLDDQSKVLLDRHSSLERRHKDLMETRRYILDLTSSRVCG